MYSHRGRLEATMPWQTPAEGEGGEIATYARPSPTFVSAAGRPSVQPPSTPHRDVADRHPGPEREGEQGRGRIDGHDWRRRDGLAWSWGRCGWLQTPPLLSAYRQGPQCLPPLRGRECSGPAERIQGLSGWRCPLAPDWRAGVAGMSAAAAGLCAHSFQIAQPNQWPLRRDDVAESSHPAERRRQCKPRDSSQHRRSCHTHTQTEPARCHAGIFWPPHGRMF